MKPLALIARYSDGGMRDAQVTLDQITSFAKDKISPEDVAKLLGVVDDEILFGLSAAISEKNAMAALKIIDRLMNEGKDATQVVLGLIEHFRNITIVKITKNADSLIDAGEEKIKDYETQSQKFTIEEMLYIIYTLSNTIDFIRKSNLARIPLEAAMVKLTRRGSVLSLDEVMKRLDNIGQVECRAAAQATYVEGPAVKPKPEIAPENTPPHAAAGFNELLSSWTNVINYIMPKKMSVASYLQEGHPTKLETNTLTIGFPKALQFHKEVLESPENRRLVEEAVKQVLALDLRINFTLDESVNGRRGNASSASGGDDDIDELGVDEPKKEMDPIVKAALDVFGGDITSQGFRKRAR